MKGKNGESEDESTWLPSKQETAGAAHWLFERQKSMCASGGWSACALVSPTRFYLLCTRFLCLDSTGGKASMPSSSTFQPPPLPLPASYYIASLKADEPARVVRPHSLQRMDSIHKMTASFPFVLGFCSIDCSLSFFWDLLLINPSVSALPNTFWADNLEQQTSTLCQTKANNSWIFSVQF